MTSAADAFIRVTGELAVASGTEGPGFTNMICAIAAANACRTPLLVVASNMNVRYDDTERAIQRGYQQPTTEGIKKYGKRIVTGERIHEYAGYAFRALRTGVPGPVHLDFVGESSSPVFESSADLDLYHDKAKYRTESKPHPDPADIRKAVEMIQKAERPMIVASTGAFYSKAWDALLQVAEKNQIPVVESAPMRGQFSDGHALSASCSPDALYSVDLVVLVGQYCMPNVGEFVFPAEAKWIRIHPEGGDIGRNMPIDLGIVSDERAALEALAEELPSRKRDAWVAEIAEARAAFEAENEEYYATGKSYTDAVHQAVIGKELADFLYKGDIPRDQTTFVAGGFGIARYLRRYMRAYRPGQICNGAYQYGSIGPDVGYAMGVGVAVQNGVGPQAPYKGSPVVCVTGDAGFGYSGIEVETLSKYKIPAIVIVWNNNAWGTWPGGSRDPHVGHVHLFQENLRYDKMGEALGAHGEYVTTPDGFTPALERAWKVAVNESRPSVINCQARKDFSSGALAPPGMLGKVEPGCMAYNH
jgi:thiamine pyrophosphate-dependent acetolactate synthase large subunit-like protein